jgi:hypothetical protein
MSCFALLIFPLILPFSYRNCFVYKHCTGSRIQGASTELCSDTTDFPPHLAAGNLPPLTFQSTLLATRTPTHLRARTTGCPSEAESFSGPPLLPFTFPSTPRSPSVTNSVPKQPQFPEASSPEPVISRVLPSISTTLSPARPVPSLHKILLSNLHNLIR